MQEVNWAVVAHGAYGDKFASNGLLLVGGDEAMVVLVAFPPNMIDGALKS